MDSDHKPGDRTDGVYFAIAIEALADVRQRGNLEEERRLLAHIRRYVPEFERVPAGVQPVLPLEFCDE